MTEAKFLQEQARDASRAMKRSFSALCKSAEKTIDPREIARSHPFTSLGVALGIGVATGLSLGSRRQAGKRIVEYVKPESLDADDLTPEPASPKAGAIRGLSMYALRTAMRMLRPIITRAVLNLLHPPEPEPPPSNGHSGVDAESPESQSDL